jgi:hypothetical protein
MQLQSESVTRVRRVPFGLAEQARWHLWGVALSVLAVVAIRAVIQSITIDEGDTYVYWVSGKFHKPWYPHSNNHLLNTYFIWVFVHLFGLNNVSMRLPSFIGALLYLSATYRFCISFVDRLSLRLPLYACFTLNPFVLDFFVAARGYGLALGFLMTAVVTMCQLLVDKPASRRSLLARFAFVSACLGLSFVANFSFAFVIAISFGLFLLIWAATEFRYAREIRPAPVTGRLRFYVQIAIALLPGPLIVVALAGWTLLHWPNGELVVGASSLSGLWQTFLVFTFSDLNPRILPAYLMKTFRHWRKALPWVLIALCALEATYIGVRRKQWRYRLSANHAVLVCAYLSAVVVVTLFAHWLAFHLTGLLMPKDRTSIFFLPLCLMIVGIVASFPHADFIGSALRWATVAILVVGSAYFIGCLRFRYFLQWRFDADMEESYRKLVQIVGPGHQVEVPCDFIYTSSLNYYREYFHDDSFGRFWLFDNPKRAPNTHYKPYPLNQPVYVLTLPQDEDFIAQQHLRVVYKGPVSDVVIAVKPGVGVATQAPR